MLPCNVTVKMKSVLLLLCYVDSSHKNVWELQVFTSRFDNFLTPSSPETSTSKCINQNKLIYSTSLKLPSHLKKLKNLNDNSRNGNSNNKYLIKYKYKCKERNIFMRKIGLHSSQGMSEPDTTSDVCQDCNSVKSL